MVRAAKAFRQQQSGPNAAQQVDANVLLDSFEGWLSRGLPDEALRVATIAADLFSHAGDRIGESKAFTCVEKAIAAGAKRDHAVSVGDSSLLLGSGSVHSVGSASQEPSMSVLGSNDYGDTLMLSRESADKEPTQDGSSFADTDFTQLPISYGEMLVLKTAMKCRGRPYDRQRQDFLAKPRDRRSSPETWGLRDSVSTTDQSGTAEACSSSRGPGDQSRRQESKSLSSKETDSLVARLTQPKRIKHHSRPPGEQIVMRSQEMSREKAKVGFDLKAMVARLASPRFARMSSPTPGERIVVSWSRSEHARRPDPQRIKDLATSTRRGGSARAWGILPPAAASTDRCNQPMHESLPSATCGNSARMAPQAHPQRPPATVPPLQQRPMPGAMAQDTDSNEDLEDLQDDDLPGLPDLESSQQMDDFAMDTYQDQRSWRSGVDRRA